MESSKPLKSDFSGWAQKARVPLAFLFGVFFAVSSRPTFGTMVAGLIPAGLGLGLRIWASGCIEKSRELEMRGPYRYTRNPLYLGSFLMGIGACIAAGNVWLMCSFLLVFILVYGAVMKREEEELQLLFPATFPDYQSSVPLFWPRLTATATGGRPAEGRGRLRFRWARVWRNREYNAALGVAALFAWMWFQIWVK
jgi:protein-S-isoprenylcysteine O-methyltransferase Ste14